MNKKYFLHFRIYTRFSFNDLKTAERFCKRFVDEGGTFIPTAFSATEPIRIRFDPQDVHGPAELLSTSSHHILLRRSKPRWLAYIYWLKGRTRPWFWTFDFGKEWTKDDVPKQAVEFLTKLCIEFPAIFAVGGLTTDWFDKHDVYDPKTGKFRESAGANFNPGTGLPGIYWFNFFGEELVAHFGRAKLLELADIQVMYDSNNGIALLAYPTPDEFDKKWRRNREHLIVRKLGEEYFFSLDNATEVSNSLREPIIGVTDAKAFNE